MKIYSRTERVRLYAAGVFFNLHRVLPNKWWAWVVFLAFLYVSIKPGKHDFLAGYFMATWIAMLTIFCTTLCDYAKLYVMEHQWHTVRGYVIRRGEKFPICVIVPPTVEATNRDIVSQIKGQV